MEYRRRAPEQTVLHQGVRENLNTFLGEADVLACPRCSSRMAVIATIDRASVAAKILRSMGLPDEAPPVAPARPRPPPQQEFDFVQ